jgi:hypothetical protein
MSSPAFLTLLQSLKPGNARCPTISSGLPTIRGVESPSFRFPALEFPFECHGSPLPLPYNLQCAPCEFMRREAQTSDLPSSRAVPEGSWPARQLRIKAGAQLEIQLDRAGERRKADLPSWTRSLQKRSCRRQFQHQPGRHPFLRSVSERPIAERPTPCGGRSRATSARPCMPTSRKFQWRPEAPPVQQIRPPDRQKNGVKPVTDQGCRS